jgi:FkbM family methyltransferase
MVNLNEDAVFARYRFKQPGAFVDVGANLGLFFAPFARRGIDIVAFEPHPELFALLKQTYAGQQHVRIVQRAISDKAGVLPFYTSDEHPGIHSLAAFHPTHKPTVQVEVSTLETELSRMSIRSVAALKIDTEGADLLALRSLNFVERRPELVMVEFMDKRSLEYFGYSHHDMAAFMADQGYETWVSEWAAIEEYGRTGEDPAHRWLGLSPYSRDRAPAWGNLICVQPEDRRRLQAAVRASLRRARAREIARAAPGARILARAARSGLRRVAALRSRRIQ